MSILNRIAQLEKRLARVEAKATGNPVWDRYILIETAFKKINFEYIPTRKAVDLSDTSELKSSSQALTKLALVKEPLFLSKKGIQFIANGRFKTDVMGIPKQYTLSSLRAHISKVIHQAISKSPDKNEHLEGILTSTEIHEPTLSSPIVIVKVYFKLGYPVDYEGSRY